MTIEEIKELYKMIADRDDTIAVLYARIAELEAFQETWLCRRDKTGEANCQLETGSDCWPPQPPVLRVLNKS